MQRAAGVNVPEEMAFSILQAMHTLQSSGHAVMAVTMRDMQLATGEAMVAMQRVRERTLYQLISKFIVRAVVVYPFLPVRIRKPRLLFLGQVLCAI